MDLYQLLGVRRNATVAIDSAVSRAQKFSGFRPNHCVRASGAYGTTASSTEREPPGTPSRRDIAAVPPPVIASTVGRPLA